MSIDVESLYNRRADNRWDRMAVGDMLERMALSDPHQPAFIAAPCAVVDPRFSRVSYQQADRICNQIANRLLQMGLERGERVALLCENSIEAYLFKLGIAKAGMVALPINTVMAADMVAYLLDFIGVRFAAVDGALWASGREPFETAGTQILLKIGIDQAGLLDAVPDFGEFIQDQPENDPEVTIHGDDIWQILPTSGTTSMPKAVMISHSFSYIGAYSQALSFSRGVDIEHRLKICTFLPVVYHVGDQGLVLGALICGGSVIIGRKFDPAAIARNVTDEKPTALWAGSPSLIRELLREYDARPGDYDFSSLTVFIYGWGAIPPEINKRIEAIAPSALLVGVFGQTESIAFHKFWPARWPEQYEKTAPAVNYVGLPSPMLGSIIMDDQGRSLADKPGVPGEAVYRSPAVTPGYFRDEKATREAFKHGWFHSGDLCTYDEDGLRIMVDRSKDMIKSGGENVSSLRVEAVVAQHPSVRQAAVIGLPDEKWGERVTAVVVLQPGESLDTDAIIGFCRERLAGYESPKQVVALDEIPVTVGGKVLKYKLRQQLA